MPPVYATLGFGITAQASLNAAGFPGAIIGQPEFSTVIPPLLLPLQLTASNPKPEFNIVPSTTPQDIYVRIPGVGQRFLRGLRMSIEYPTALAIPPLPLISPGPLTIGIWAGSIPDGTTPPILSQTLLTVTIQAFAQGNNSRFQSASNLTNIVPVQGGDYIAMVVYYPTVTVGPSHPYIEASVELI